MDVREPCSRNRNDSLLQVYVLLQLACCMTPSLFTVQTVSCTHTHAGDIRLQSDSQLGRQTPTFLRNPPHFYPGDGGSVRKMLTSSIYKATQCHMPQDWHFNTVRTGDADLRFLHYNCARRMTQICVFNTRLFSLHNTLNYAIHRACPRMFLLTDVYRNLTSLWINL